MQLYIPHFLHLDHLLGFICCERLGLVSTGLVDLIQPGLKFLPPLHRFIAFLGVYAGIINNQNFSRFVRYNAMQAVLLDVLLM